MRSRTQAWSKVLVRSEFPFYLRISILGPIFHEKEQNGVRQFLHQKTQKTLGSKAADMVYPNSNRYSGKHCSPNRIIPFKIANISFWLSNFLSLGQPVPFLLFGTVCKSSLCAFKARKTWRAQVVLKRYRVFQKMLRKYRLVSLTLWRFNESHAQ